MSGVEEGRSVEWREIGRMEWSGSDGGEEEEQGGGRGRQGRRGKGGKGAEIGNKNERSRHQK